MLWGEFSEAVLPSTYGTGAAAIGSLLTIRISIKDNVENYANNCI